MMSEFKSFKFNKEYDFNVSASFSNGHTYAGTITIQKQTSTIKLYGEFHSRDETSILYLKKLETLECKNFNHIFILYNLSNQSFGANDLGNNRIAFSLIFDFQVLYVLSKKANQSNLILKSIRIVSPSITEWVGITEKLATINKHIANRDPELHNFLPSKEFTQHLNNNNFISISYGGQYTNDIHNHQIISSYKPILKINFSEPHEINKAIDFIDQLMSLFYLLTGSKISIESISLTAAKKTKRFSALSRNEQILTWFNNPNIFTNENTLNNHQMLTCYESANRFSFNEKGNFPVNSLSKFFTLKQPQISLYKKFRHFDQTTSLEEKFLGFFKIIEVISYREDQYFDDSILDNALSSFKDSLKNSGIKSKKRSNFINRIKKINKQKLNTHSNFTYYIDNLQLSDSIKSNIQHWFKETEAIVNMRNNITHSNYEDVDQKKLEKYCLFLEFLSICALLDLLGLANEDRINGLTHKRNFKRLLNSEY